jgi:hypothetical protein
MPTTTASRSAQSPAVDKRWNAYQKTYALKRGKGATEDDAYEGGKMAHR